ncbi:glycoside hydrolase family 16 protein [Promicromonospora sp. NPDC023805]|uniref:beta-glucanase n=1 Tax=Promicromonospora sp. NPDC023805 TaxID=3154696 RepID=UPI0033D958B0
MRSTKRSTTTQPRSTARSRRRLLSLAPALALGLLLGLSAVPGLTPPAAAVGGSFTDNFDSHNGGRWNKADGWSNGGMFNAGWRADHVWHSGGVMGLNLNNTPCPGGCSGKPYASGEYRTNELYSYGRYEVRMKAASGSGIVSSFFTYTGPSDGQPWDEIDVEILGKNTWQMQTNYFTGGVGGHEAVINLGFDAAAGYHNYAIEWRSGNIKWFVDGRQVHEENGSRGALPTRPQRIMMNLWPGTGVDGWLGPFNYTGQKTATYDWVRYTQY